MNTSIMVPPPFFYGVTLWGVCVAFLSELEVLLVGTRYLEDESQSTNVDCFLWNERATSLIFIVQKWPCTFWQMSRTGHSLSGGVFSEYRWCPPLWECLWTGRLDLTAQQCIPFMGIPYLALTVSRDPVNPGRFKQRDPKTPDFRKTRCNSYSCRLQERTSRAKYAHMPRKKDPAFRISNAVRPETWK